MALAQAYQVSIPHNTWTLVAQSPAGNGTYQYHGFSATGPAVCKFRSFIAATEVATPTNPQFRHSYTTSVADRSALVIDNPEIYSTYVWLECLQTTGLTITVDGTILGGT